MPCDTTAAQQFFGDLVTQDLVELASGSQSDMYCWSTAGLAYEMRIDPATQQVAISADPTTPFGGHSLFEIYRHFDIVGIETEPQFYGDTPQLVFRRQSGEELTIVLMIMVWTDTGTVSVWS